MLARRIVAAPALCSAQAARARVSDWLAEAREFNARLGIQTGNED